MKTWACSRQFQIFWRKNRSVRKKPGPLAGSRGSNSPGTSAVELGVEPKMEVVNMLKYAAILMKENILVLAALTSFPSKSTIGNSTGLDCPQSCLLSSETINLKKNTFFYFWTPITFIWEEVSIIFVTIK